MKKTIKNSAYISVVFCVCILIASCKHKGKKDTYSVLNYQPFTLPSRPPDSTIIQNLWIYKGKYVLQTVVYTEINQQVLSSYVDAQMFIDNGNYAPYNKEITGSYEYIKSNKTIEHAKANYYLDSIKEVSRRLYPIWVKDSIKNKLMNDSLELLKSIKP